MPAAASADKAPLPASRDGGAAASSAALGAGDEAGREELPDAPPAEGGGKRSAASLMLTALGIFCAVLVAMGARRSRGFYRRHAVPAVLVLGACGAALYFIAEPPGAPWALSNQHTVLSAALLAAEAAVTALGRRPGAQRRRQAGPRGGAPAGQGRGAAPLPMLPIRRIPNSRPIFAGRRAARGKRK